MTVQYIQNKGQPQYAIIPVAEYQQLLQKSDMLDDVKAFDQAILENEESIPADMVAKLINGENKIKVWRNHRAMTQSELAKKAGIAQVTISLMEKNKRTGTLEVINKIAKALAVDIDDITD